MFGCRITSRYQSINQVKITDFFRTLNLHKNFRGGEGLQHRH